MTIIAAAVHEDRVLMGADRIGTQWDEMRVPLAESKIRLDVGPGGRFVLGFAGVRRISQETRRRWEPPSGSLPETFPYDVAASLEQHLVSDDAMRRWVIDQEHETLNGRFLLGWAGKLFMIGCDFTVDELTDGFWAIGCAADYAIGAFTALEGLDLAPLDRLGKALDAAARFDVHVAAPFDVVTT